MIKQQKQYNKKCQVFTPQNYVETLLDYIDYNEECFGKKILENSCGDGNILSSIVRRYIQNCKKRNLPVDLIARGLETDIYGVEIDPEQYKKCINKLTDILNKEQIPIIPWTNICNADYLRLTYQEDFDYIVGNPPYITYSELGFEERSYLKVNFDSCKKGKFDYCYAFIEKSVRELSPNGKMSYLIPSSIFKTVFGKNLRDIILKYTKVIDDFTSENMFSQALVKSSIIVFEKNENNTHIEYKDRVKNIYERVFMEKLKNKWFFLEVESEKHKTHRFGDYFNVSHVVATLLNKTFILKDWKYVDGFYEYNNFQIEENLIKDTCTPRSLRYNTNEKIIFPYYYKDDKLHKYSEQEFKTIFPKGYKYLQSYRKELLKRKSDRTAQWFEYGRSQALNHINKDKLLISTIITNSVSLYKIPSECIPYAGMYIIPKCKSFSLDDAKRILESKMFLSYVQNVGIHISGESVRITSKDIMDFRF